MQWLYDYNLSITSGNGVDSTAGLQAAINSAAAAGKGLVLTRSYYVHVNGDAGPILNIPANSYIKFIFGAQLRMLPHASNWYQVFYIATDNVTIEDGYVDGNREENTVSDPSGTGTGLAFAIYGGTNVNLINCTGINMWNDAFYTAEGAANVLMTRPVARACRRNGMSIISCDGLTIVDYQAINIGTDETSVAPMAALDFEPDSNNDVLRNIKIHGMTMYHCNNGLTFNPAALTSGGSVPKVIDIEVNDLVDYGCFDQALGGDGVIPGITGRIRINNAKFVGSNIGVGTFAEWDHSLVPVAVNNTTVVR